MNFKSANFKSTIAALCLAFSLSLCLLFAGAPPAIASVHAYPIDANQTIFRSLQSLRDRSGRAWQVVFFDRVDRGLIEQIRLRLVGFPGLELTRSPLSIVARTGQSWSVPSVTTVEPNVVELPPNTAEFEMFDVMRELTGESVIELEMALQTGDRVALTVPVALVREWRSVLDRR